MSQQDNNDDTEGAVYRGTLAALEEHAKNERERESATRLKIALAQQDFDKKMREMREDADTAARDLLGKDRYYWFGADET